jgi:hypothetical protein
VNTNELAAVTIYSKVKRPAPVDGFPEDRGEAYWFAPDLLEFVDHAIGTEIRIEGVSKKWVRTADGDWEESQVAQRGLVQRLLGIFKRNH